MALERMRNGQGRFVSQINVTQTEKECTMCHRMLPFDCYTKSSARKDGLQCRCRECDNAYKRERIYCPTTSRWNQILKKYGMTQEVWELLFLSQGQRCAICETKEFGKAGPQTDHDRKCCPDKKTCGGCIRGILCLRCNVVVGNIENGWNVEVPAIIYYLELYSERKVHVQA